MWGQRMHLKLTVLELVLLIAGAFTALLDFKNSLKIDLPQLIGAILFVGALAIRAYRASEQFERRWFEGRAAAESIKSLSWRYAVGGNPFAKELSEEEVEREYATRLREIIQTFSAPRLRPSRPMDQSITEWMRLTRRKSLRERVSEYSLGRIKEQQFWYATKAYLNARAHRRWNLVLVLLELLGFGIGLAQAMNAIGGRRLSALALMAAIIAAITVWTHARQFASLASAYAQADQELLLITDLVDRTRSEVDWGEFVESAETAISREHRIWQSSRMSV
jgi:hypothetical protein